MNYENGRDGSCISGSGVTRGKGAAWYLGALISGLGYDGKWDLYIT